MELVSTLKELLHLHPLYNEQLKSFAAFGGTPCPCHGRFITLMFSGLQC